MFLHFQITLSSGYFRKWSKLISKVKLRFALLKYQTQPKNTAPYFLNHLFLSITSCEILLHTQEKRKTLLNQTERKPLKYQISKRGSQVSKRKLNLHLVRTVLSCRSPGTRDLKGELIVVITCWKWHTEMYWNVEILQWQQTDIGRYQERHGLCRQVGLNVVQSAVSSTIPLLNLRYFQPKFLI